MASLLIFSSIISFILAKELPTPDRYRQDGPYGRRPTHYGVVSNVRTSYRDGIAGNNILAVRRNLIKNHNTGANENRPNLKTEKLYSDSSINLNNNRFTRTNAHQSNIDNEKLYRPTNNFPINNNFGSSGTNNGYTTNSRNSVSDGVSSLSNNKYRGDYVSNSYSYENHDDFVNQNGGGGSKTGSGNRGRDDIYNTHSGFRDSLNDYGNSGIEEYGNTVEYGSVDAIGEGFNPLQGISASGSSPQENESHQNTVIQGPHVASAQDIHSSSGGNRNTQSTQRQGRLEDTVNRQGHGGGYKEDEGVDLYSLLALGLFAAFLGYVIFYYISITPAARRSIDLNPQEYATLIMAEVFNALERWTLVELMPSLKNKTESKLLLIRR